MGHKFYAKTFFEAAATGCQNKIAASMKNVKVLQRRIHRSRERVQTVTCTDAVHMHDQ